MRKNKGFVLIEAIGVFCLIAIMIIVVFTSLMKARELDKNGEGILNDSYELAAETGQPALGAVEDISFTRFGQCVEKCTERYSK